MSKRIAQNMAYQQSLMQYAEKYGVGQANRKYNGVRSYIYFWKMRWYGTAQSLCCRSRRPHHHPNVYHDLLTRDAPEIKTIIRDLLLSQAKRR